MGELRPEACLGWLLGLCFCLCLCLSPATLAGGLRTHTLPSLIAEEAPACWGWFVIPDGDSQAKVVWEVALLACFARGASHLTM